MATASPAGIILSHTAPSGATHSNAFHVVKRVNIDNELMTNNMVAKIEVYDTQLAYGAGKAAVDSFSITMTLSRSQGTTSRVSSHSGDPVWQVYTELLTNRSAAGPSGRTIDYTSRDAAGGVQPDRDQRPSGRG